MKDVTRRERVEGGGGEKRSLKIAGRQATQKYISRMIQEKIQSKKYAKRGGRKKNQQDIKLWQHPRVGSAHCCCC